MLNSPTLEVTVGLARAHYEKLLRDLPTEARAHPILRRTQRLELLAEGRPFSMCVIVECETPDEAIALLEAARKYCPGAISDILYALKTAGALHLIGSTP